MFPLPLSLCALPWACVRVPPMGYTNLSIRIKELQKPRSLSRVSTDPLIWNAKCVREWARPRQLPDHICISVPVRALPTRWPKMATLFALLHSCGWIIKMQKGPRSTCACVCARVRKSVCWGISIPLLWAICGQTDPIMFMLQDQIGFVSSSLAEHRCPFQPDPCTSQHPFKSVAQGVFLFRFQQIFQKSNSGFSPWQLSWTDVNNYFGRRTKDRRIIAYKCKMFMSEHVKVLNATNVCKLYHIKA